MGTNPSESTSALGSIKENVSSSLSASDWKERYETVQNKARLAVNSSEDFVKAHPFYTILGAATVGFVAGMLIRKNQ